MKQLGLYVPGAPTIWGVCSLQCFPEPIQPTGARCDNRHRSIPQFHNSVTTTVSVLHTYVVRKRILE